MQEEEEEEESFDAFPRLSGALPWLATGGGISPTPATSTPGAKPILASLPANSVFIWEQADKDRYPPFPEGFCDEPEQVWIQTQV